MKNKSVRSCFLTGLFLVWALLVGSLAAYTEASEPETGRVGYYVNPLYAEFFSPEDLETTPESAEETLVGGSTSGIKYYTGISAAGKALAVHLKKHESGVDIGFKISGDVPSTLCREIFLASLSHTGDPKGGDYMRSQYGGAVFDYLSATKSGSTWKLVIRFTVTWMTTSSQEAAVDKAVSSVIAGMKQSASTDYEKVRYLYDYVCSRVTYDYYNLNDSNYKLKFTAYSALIRHSAVCNGYAALMYRLLLTAGIDARFIGGETTEGESHAWNIVRLGSVYYNMDSTWDSERDPYQYFLLSPESFKDHIRLAEYASSSFMRDYPMAARDYQAASAVVSVNGIRYEIAGGEARVAGYTISPVDLVLPSSAGGYPVTGISGDAFCNCETLRSVTIPSSVKKICNGSYTGSSVKGAFANCSSLESVRWSGSPKLTSIGYAAFWNCDALTSVPIPASVRTIWAAAFGDCASLRVLDLPSGVQEIYEGAFSYLTAATLYIRNRSCEIYDSYLTIGSSVAIVGYPDSTAARYASRYNRSFTALEDCRTHVYGNYEVLRKATCLETGIRLSRCTICGEIRKETVPLAAHSYSTALVNREATALKTGNKVSFCQICGKQKTVRIPKLKPAWKLSAAKLTLRKGQTTKAFKVTGLAKGDYVKKWKMSKSSVASVKGKKNGTCTIKARKKGSATLKITLASGKVLKVPVKVKRTKVKTSSIRVNVSSAVSLKKGSKKTIKVTLLPITTEDSVKVSVNKPKTAAVTVRQSKNKASVVVKGKKKGTVTLRIKAGKKSRKIKIKITK